MKEMTSKSTPLNWMPRNRLTGLIKTTPRKVEGTKEDRWRDFWMRGTGTGQQVAQLLDCYIMTMMLLRQVRISCPNALPTQHASSAPTKHCLSSCGRPPEYTRGTTTKTQSTPHWDAVIVVYLTKFFTVVRSVEKDLFLSGHVIGNVYLVSPIELKEGTACLPASLCAASCGML
jgi:hypothetical protein